MDLSNPVSTLLADYYYPFNLLPETIRICIDKMILFLFQYVAKLLYIPNLLLYPGNYSGYFKDFSKKKRVVRALGTPQSLATID